MTSNQRYDSIDVLRGISILLVILLHIFIRMHFADYKLDLTLPPLLSHLVFRNGDNGVTIFFAISGFLITYTSIQRFGSLAALRPVMFYRIRFARIMPLLLLVLAVLSVLHLAHVEGLRINLKRESLPGALFAALTFHLNWYEAVHGYLPANWDVMWSLSVEEMFYLFFPLCCVLLLRFKGGLWLFVTLLLGFVVIGPPARALWTGHDIWQDSSYLGGMDAIALGCITALITAWAKPRAPSRKLLLALQILGAVLIFWILLSPRWYWIRPTMRSLAHASLDQTILPLGTCLVIFGSVLRNRPGRMWTAPVRWFGRHSYEVYLTHEFIVILGTELLVKLHRGPLLLWAAGIVLVTAPLGWAVARYFSEPMNRRLRGTQKATS